MMRGATLVHEIWPNVGEVNSTSGSQNCGWLKALKNSVRNSRTEFSRGPVKRKLLAYGQIKVALVVGFGNSGVGIFDGPRPFGSSALHGAGAAKQLALI
jgi:hypothetical protein